MEEQPKLPPKPNKYFNDLSPTRISPTHSPPKSSVMPMPEPRNKYSSNEYLPERPIKENVPEYFAFTEGGEGLRTMIMPINIYDKFIQIAASNTAKNLETCGVLCGRLSHNYFTVTSLVIPKQTATSDTCSMTNEEELLEYIEENDLLMLGWIHTHPTQTCFMSSMDLHTHSAYQLILPEAIAIVCAPNKSPNIGIFRLTNPPGLQTVLQCEKRGFHPHDSSEEIDVEISNCGHVVMEKFDLTVVDLR
ncbi:7034_t:CDS:2 [Entrophospora sp. SA101]|nr:7034_t:CDS:2 [Entrophospora sp. SA101]CAJ0845282.1 558_t:CDS:2 [Entrophospora sp. SA101]CAJ0871666.1 8099_t:CDS:2 [Entrophospora sp. SA101]